MERISEDRARHKRVIRRAAWLLAAVAACVSLSVLMERFPVEENRVASDRLFLDHAGQGCGDVELQLSIDADRLLVHGTARAMVRQEGPITELRFLLHHSLRLDRVLIGKVAYEEVEPWYDAVVSSSRHRRRLVAEVDEIDGHELPSDGELQIHFQGSALPFAGTGGESPLPLVFAAEDHYCPVVAPGAIAPQVELILPKLRERRVPWTVFSDGEVTEGDEIRLVSGNGARTPSFALGPLIVKSFSDGDREVRIASLHDEFPSSGAVKEAVTAVSLALPQLLPSRVDLIADPHYGGARPRRLGPALLVARPPGDRAELVRILATAALPESAGTSSPTAIIPELVALQGLSGQDLRSQRDARARLRAGAADPVALDAWLAVQGTAENLYVGHALTSWAERWIEEGDDAELQLEDRASRALRDWVLKAGGVDVRFGESEWNEVNRTYDLEAEVILEPWPRGLELPPLQVVVLTREGWARTLTVRWEDGRGTVSADRIEDRPLRLVLDPGDRFPDRDRRDNVLSFSSEPEPALFACSQDTSLLALAPSVVDQADQRPFGVYVYALDPVSGPTYRRWYELPQRLQRLRWLGRDDHLFLEFPAGSRGGRFGLLNLEDGRLRRFHDQCAPASTGDHVLLNREQAPGRWRHRLYSVESGREVSLLNEFPGRLHWVEGSGLVFGSSSYGVGEIRSLDGEERGSLSVAAEELRLVRHSPTLGLTYVTEHAMGSVLKRMVTDGIEKALFQSSGRLIDYAFSTEPGDIEVIAYAQEDDGEYTVWEVRTKTQSTRLLYRGAARPIPGLHLPNGVLLTSDPRGDEAGTVELYYRPFPRNLDEPVSEGIRLCEEAFLEPPPILSSAGRYLYYVRTGGEQGSLPDCYRRRALFRYDLLDGSQEPVFKPGG